MLELICQDVHGPKLAEVVLAVGPDVFFSPGAIGWVQLAPSCQVCMRQAAHLEELQEELKKAWTSFESWWFVKVLLVISLDSAACDVQQWFSVRWKNLQARTAETTAIEATTCRYNQCSKTATVPVSQALEQERKMHALGTPSWKNPRFTEDAIFQSCLRQEKAEFTEKVEQMSNLQVQSESKLQTFYFLFFHIFSIQKRPSIITIGSLTPIFCVEKKSISFGTGGITWLDGELQGYIRLVGEKSSHSQPNQAALQRENHLLLEELISVLGRTKVVGSRPSPRNHRWFRWWVAPGVSGGAFFFSCFFFWRCWTQRWQLGWFDKDLIFCVQKDPWGYIVWLDD